ncbi:MAG: isochorismate synthase [Thiogranum sp.]|jgi:menaquinone-specific isochorismate synthase|nr:isochorismate synthase [Thiogranum sp.]
MPIDTLLRELNRRLHALLADPPLTRTGGILTLCLAIPPQTRIPAIGNCSDCLYWSRPSLQHQRVGAGRITLVETAGAKRFEQLEQSLQEDWRMLDPDCTGVSDLVFCGFAFDGDDTHAGASAGFANSLLFIPEVLVEQRAEHSRLVVSCRTGNHCDVGTIIDNWLYRLRRLLSPADAERPAARDPRRLWPISVPDDRHRWIERVEEALLAIDNGQLRKVVLSRHRRVELPDHFRLRDTLAWLAPRYPDCTLFALRHAGQTLLGVSPENLLTLDRQRLHVDAVGGTTERSADPVRDRQLAATLRHSHKTLSEHRLVVEDIVRQLRPYCRGLVYPQQPDILKLPAVQHLHSRISGQARVGTSVLQLAARLHPTAATGGLPRPAALDWLRCHGEPQRGWYTGALGWLNTAGDGELAVILRCAVLGQRQATLYAGAGIVAGSDPQQEFLETEWKLQTMLAALRAGGDGAPQLPAQRHDTGQAP